MLRIDTKTKFKGMCRNAHREQSVQEKHFGRTEEESLDWSGTHLGSENHDIR